MKNLLHKLSGLLCRSGSALIPMNFSSQFINQNIMNKFKIKLLVVLNCFFIGSTNANSDILSQNIRDYRTSVDEVIIQFVNTGKAPTIDQALRIQSCENDMLALARLDPSIADSLPALLLANYAKLQDLRHLPGELILGRAKTAGLDILSSRFKENEIEYKKGNL